MNRNGDGSDGELFDPNKIKINLNLTDELKQQLHVSPEVLANSSSGRSNGNGQDGESCGTYIPKDSLVSLCRGCDPDKL